MAEAFWNGLRSAGSWPISKHSRKHSRRFGRYRYRPTLWLRPGGSACHRSYMVSCELHRSLIGERAIGFVRSCTSGLEDVAFAVLFPDLRELCARLVV